MIYTGIAASIASSIDILEGFSGLSSFKCIPNLNFNNYYYGLSVNAPTDSYNLSANTDFVNMKRLSMKDYLDGDMITTLSGSNVLKGRYKLKDALEFLKITNSNFKTIKFSFPDTTLIPTISNTVIGNHYTGSKTLLPFLGTNKIILSGNTQLTDIIFDSYMFNSAGYNSNTLHNPSVTTTNNPKLTALNCWVNYHQDAVAAPTYPVDVNFNIYDPIKHINLTINNNGSSNRTSTPFNRSYLDNIIFTFNNSSSAIETFNLSLTSNHYNYPTFGVTSIILSSCGNPLPDSTPILTVDSNYLPSSGIPYFHNPYLDLSGLDKLPFSSLSGVFLNHHQNISFTKMKKTTQMDFISSNGNKIYPPHYPNSKFGLLELKFTGDPISAEAFSKYLIDDDIFNPNGVGGWGIGGKSINYDLIPTKPNTLLYEQHRMVTDPLSGKKQPYSFYSVISATPWNVRDDNNVSNNRIYNGINPRFGMNVNSVYSWPLSVLNNTNLYTDTNQYTSNIIHPRFVVTAAHLDPSKPGFPLPMPVHFRDLNTGIIYDTRVMSSYTIPGTDVAIYELNPVLPLSAFPGFYILPKALYDANKTTKIPLWFHGFDMSQDKDVTPAAFGAYGTTTSGGIEKLPVISSDEGTYLSYKHVRGGDSGTPKMCFINKKPVLLMTYTYGGASGGGGASVTYYSDQIQAKVNELAGGPVQLNLITQADLDVYENLYD